MSSASVNQSSHSRDTSASRKEPLSLGTPGSSLASAQHRYANRSPYFATQVIGEGEDITTTTTASSTTTTPSTVLSVMSSSSANHPPILLTPVTMSESSPVDKMPSPSSRKRSYEDMHANGAVSPSRPSAPSRDVAALTPTQTPPEPTRQARPARGEILGYKITLDPDTAPGLDHQDRRKIPVKYKPFGQGKEVRAASSQVFC
jgi:hypothetical protein